MNTAALHVISISGPQATGKTTLATATARAIGGVKFSRDPLMDVLQRGGVPQDSDPATGAWGFPMLGYGLQAALMHEQLGCGQSVVLECIAPEPVQDSWRQTAESKGARFWIVETVCSDAALHRRRFDERGQSKRGDWVLTWDVVEETMQAYTPHPDALYIADSVNSVDDNVAGRLTRLTAAQR